MSFPLQRKTTLQTATTIATTSVDPNLRQKYGTSVDEFMSREHQKEIQKKIGELRQQFQVINKDKNSFISKEELVDFFSHNNQYNEVYYLFILLYRVGDQLIRNILRTFSLCWIRTKITNFALRSS